MSSDRKIKRPLSKEQTRAPRNPARSFPIVGVGASAGGLEAFTQLLEHLPADTGMGFVLVQHLDRLHPSALAQLLAKATAMPVMEATEGVRIEPNKIYVIPPDQRLSIAGGRLRLKRRPARPTLPRSIDFFLESLAHDCRDQAIGVILSGTATDGTLGLEAIKSEGGITFVQDASAKYTSMPRSAVAAGCVDFELSPKEIALKLARVAAHPLVAGRRAKSAGGRDAASSLLHEDDATPLPASGPGPGDNHFKQILQLVHAHSKVDFSLYKPATISRRISRRMVLSQSGTLPAYAKFLRGNTDELEALYSDMLICVTSFFRNPEAFDLLKRKVFIPLLAQRSVEPVRVWVLGCSTGQEAYSIAMAFAEAGGRAPPSRMIQIFATDLNNALLEKARAGLYAKNLSHDISPERLARFFVEEPTGYRVRKDLRESVVFARQNVLHDPPFSRIDLISCRNLLIYIEPHLQKRILPMFHYALNPGGTLFLGASEAVTGFTDLFQPIDRRHKLFTRKPGKVSEHRQPVASLRPPAQPRMAPVHAPIALPSTLPPELHAQREADRLTVNQFAPPGVLINDALQILQFRGPTGAYLEPARGKASFDVLKMARDGLALPLRAAINRARREGKPVHKQRIPLRQDGQVRLVNVQVTPLTNVSERCFLILFDEKARPAGSLPPGKAPPSESAPSARRLHSLESELTEVRDYLLTVQEQHEAAHGELQAANEEVTSANEELQSLNEELETSKEELESSNEELMTVNEEMNHRNSELNRLNADLNNLHLSINTAILVLNLDLTVRSFTPQAEKTFNFLASDLGRPLSGIRHNLELSPFGSRRRLKPRKGETLPRTLEDFVREVIATGELRECEVRNGPGQWYSLKVRPYLTQDNRIDGAVLMLVDIDRLKRAEQEARTAREYAEAVLRTARDPLLVLHADLSVNTANDAFYRTFKTTRAETEGRLLWELGNGQWNQPRLRQWLQEVLPRKSFFDDLEVHHDFPELGSRTMLLNARQLETTGDATAMILLGIEDVTERHRLDDVVRLSEERFRALTVASSQIVWTTDADGALQERDAQSWQNFTGQTYAETQGAGWLDAIHPDDHVEAKNHWRRCLADRLPLLAEYRLRRGDGVYRWTSVHAVPVFNRDGLVREWIGTHTDITERKVAEELLIASEARYRSLFNSMDEGFCVIEMISAAGQPLDYRFLEVNPSFEKQTGLAGAQGRLMRSIAPQHEEHWFEIYNQVAESGEPVRFVNEAKALGRWFDVYAFRLPPVDSRRVAVLFKDITKQRLDAIELLRVRDEAVAASRAKDEFLATLSHELRTPLNPVLLLASYNALNHDLPDAVRADFETIRNNVGLEARLIDDLLDLTLISSGKLRLDQQPCDVHTILSEAIAIVQPDLTDKRLRLSLDEQADYAGIRGDCVRLQQVFWNILRNAIHFTPIGGAISVATRSEAPGDKLTVTLTDTGSGIPAEDLERIFDAFAQGAAPPGVARRSGLGLGLAISRKMVELHGGSIHATSPGPDRGSSFVVTLPLRSKAERHPAPTAVPALASTANATGPADTFNRLLLVDDHVPTLTIMGTLLKRHGYEVRTACSVTEAVSVAKTQSLDVVISDIGLPDGDGHGLLGQLQQLQPHLQGIALSGYGTREDIARSHAAGFAEHLIKPLEINTLARALERLRDRA